MSGRSPGMTLFKHSFTGKGLPKNPGDDDSIDAFIHNLSQGYWLHNYPGRVLCRPPIRICGMIITVRMFSRRISRKRLPKEKYASAEAYGNEADCTDVRQRNEAEIWQTLIFKERRSAPKAIRRCPDALPAVKNPFRK